MPRTGHFDMRTSGLFVRGMEVLDHDGVDAEGISHRHLKGGPSASAMVASYNADIATCGHNSAWEKAFAVSRRVPG
eukprot:CAMPEP_0172494890 /NCGR_PEP_ID=MMETSP1066-20121228/57742_1 /TAXON_ID=671091 /ORGANISM="Coscinodiscus wailesii, Strain CCMP2513" /LENGTH=75 /DNA_ID=CAMNT_0013266199 /DNA_START=1 /DNA_END=225 /DNA_ORIENTATION=+